MGTHEDNGSDELAASMRELFAALDALLDDPHPDSFTSAELAAMRRLRNNVHAALAEWDAG